MSFPARHLVAALLLSVATISPAAAQRAAACKPAPVASTRTLPPYPGISVDKREQGVTEMEVMVARNGHATATRVTRSSGFARLDEAATTHVRRNYLWQPLACAPVKAQVRVVWQLRRLCELTNSCKPLPK